MRLFRQPGTDDWESVFERMAGVLTERLAAIRENQTAVPPLALKPATAASLNATGIRLAESGRLDEAAANFRQALQIDSAFADAHNNLGNALQNQGRFEEAVQHLLEAIRIHETHAEAHNNLGIVLCKQRKFVEAEKSLARALELRPEFVQALVNRGKALLETKQPVDAEACFRRALELQPGLASAHGCLGQCWPSKQSTRKRSNLFASWCALIRTVPKRITPWETSCAS